MNHKENYEMKSLFFLNTLLLINIQSFGQQISDYPFEFEKSGNGNRTIVLIPGFACSGEVWAETKAIYEKGYTCYTLTMAGFADAEPNPNPSLKTGKLELQISSKITTLKSQF